MTPGRAIAAVLRAVLPYGLVPHWATPLPPRPPAVTTLRFSLGGRGPATADEIFIGDAPVATATERRRNG